MKSKPIYSVEFRPCQMKVGDSENRCGAPAGYQVMYDFRSKWGNRIWKRWACEPCARLWAERHRLRFPERKTPVDTFCQSTQKMGRPDISTIQRREGAVRPESF